MNTISWYDRPIRMHYISRPKVPLGLGRHAGILIEGMFGAVVVERQADKGILALPVEAFSKGQQVHVEKSLSNPDEVDAAWDRLQVAVNEKGYDLFKRNCEHLARGVIYGERRSVQAEILMVALIAVFVVMITNKG
jgi:hypothetical protein